MFITINREQGNPEYYFFNRDWIRIKYIYSNRLNLGTIRSDENVFWSFAPHDISIFQYLTNDNPTKINSFEHSYLQNDISDIFIANFEYENNIKAHIFTSWANPFKEHKLVVIGLEGMLVFEDSSNNKDIIFYDKYYKYNQNNSIESINPKPQIINYDRSLPLTNELNYFIENLDGEINIADGESGSEVVKILENI